MDHDKLHQYIAETQKNISQIVLIRSGKEIYSDTWNEYKREDNIHVASVTKSILALLIGILQEQGHIKDVHTCVFDFFPEYQIKKGAKSKQKISLEDLLTMRAPFKFKSEPWTKVCMSDDWTQSVLDLLGEKKQENEIFKYTTLGIQILSSVITRTSGLPTLEFANTFLFEPLGICPHVPYTAGNREEHLKFITRKEPQGPIWFCASDLTATAGFGLCLSAGDLSKIGLLCLNKGYWNGCRIVSKEWIHEMKKAKICTGEKYGNVKFGYLWWILDEEKEIYAAIGDSGNILYINSSKDIIIAITSTFKTGNLKRIELIQSVLEPYFE